MSRLAAQLIILSSIVKFLLAQSATTIADRIVWEHDFSNLAVSTTGAAVADRDGNLWAVSKYRSSDRLICIRPDGTMVVNAELPKEIKPTPPSDVSYFSLAISPSGMAVLIARYSHADGRVIYFDGAAFAIVNSDGTLGQVKKAAQGGPEFKELVALSDEHFLLVGDQSPMVVIRLRSDGIVDWRRAFPSNWVLPSAASLENGSSCIISPDYRRSLLHMVWLDQAGEVRHREQITGQRSQAVSRTDACTILYSQSAARYQSKYFLTSFDRTFKRVWTVGV